jgi:tungstate transport system substrate-binding protein
MNRAISGPPVYARRGAMAIATTLAVTIACTSSRPPAYVDLATTTSVQNSGLLDVLLPRFRAESGAIVRVHAAGSGRALEMLADDIVDVAIAHAPTTEARYLAAHPDWLRQPIASNMFVVVGPPQDASEVRMAATAADAFRRIAAGSVAFVSRGDESGTHERELELWAAAGAKPPPDRLIISGRGMALALRHADEVNGYTLSDEATFHQLARTLDLVMLFAGDPGLRNDYSVIHRRDNAGGAAFASWLTSPAGRDLIAGYRVEGRAVFTVPAR